jgi:RNA polymerase sigma-70 factor, ECF subfamily
MMCGGRLRVDELVEWARRGDGDAFAFLVERHHAAVHRLVRARLGNEQDAQEVVQEALVRAWRELPNLRDPARFAAWLQRIAQRQCHDARSRWRQDALPIEGFEWSGLSGTSGELRTGSGLGWRA